VVMCGCDTGGDGRMERLWLDGPQQPGCRTSYLMQRVLIVSFLQCCVSVQVTVGFCAGVQQAITLSLWGK
jgi:hypothetical protein